MVGAQNYRSWRRSIEIGLSTKRKLGFVKGTVARPHIVPVPPTTPTMNAVNLELWETCNNMVISWIMSSVSNSIAKSIMFIGTASEIWTQFETRFSLSNGSRKYKLKTLGLPRRPYALSWKPCQGDSLNLPDHRIHKDGDGDASFQLKSDSLPHAHAQTTKTFYKHQDSRIMKAQELKTKTSAQTLIYKIFLQRYQVYQGRLLASFQDDAKYEHVGQDTRSLGDAWNCPLKVIKGLFAKLAEKINIEDRIVNVGGNGSGGGAPAVATPAGGVQLPAAPVAKENK
ncbi:cysteamine dioxygenase [Tanacetum coccineum]